MNKIWFITGSSRGLGRNLTEAVLESGDKVAATARDINQLSDLVTRFKDQIFPLPLDVTNYKQVYSAVQTAAEHFGRIDVLVNNAGFGIIGAAEAYTDEQVRSQLETLSVPRTVPADQCIALVFSRVKKCKSNRRTVGWEF